MSRTVRAILSAVCWTLAVVVGITTAGAFAGGGVLCESGNRKACAPQTWLILVGVVLTLALGAAGALLWKPRPKAPPRKPWDYGP